MESRSGVYSVTGCGRITTVVTHMLPQNQCHVCARRVYFIFCTTPLDPLTTQSFAGRMQQSQASLARAALNRGPPSDIGPQVLLDPLRVSQRLNCCFQFLGRPKSDFLAGLDLNRLAGRRIEPHASGSFSDLQDAKPGNSYSFALLQMLGDQSDKVVEEFAPRPFCQLVLFGQACASWLSVIVTWSAIFFP